MDAGDADPEPVVVALDAERVLVVAALRVREVSTRASGPARADEATTDGDPGWTRETLTQSSLPLPDSTLSVSSPASPYARVKRRRGRRTARARKRRQRMGIPVWTRETLTLRKLSLPLTTIASSPPFPYAPR